MPPQGSDQRKVKSASNLKTVAGQRKGSKPLQECYRQLFVLEANRHHVMRQFNQAQQAMDRCRERSNQIQSNIDQILGEIRRRFPSAMLPEIKAQLTKQAGPRRSSAVDPIKIKY
ncbi:MAG: hypothetical protein AAGI17_00810 [Planctomycetota bacterium]